MKDVIGRHVPDPKLHLYGLPYRYAGGFIFPYDEDSVELMLLAVEKFPEIHV
jgi:hypothetical protein